MGNSFTMKENTVDELRHEIKMISTEPDYFHLKSIINSHRAHFKKEYPNRQINSLYFDTESQSCRWEHLAGIPNRWKLRLRWYGQNIKPKDGFIIECKFKKNIGGGKIRQHLNDEEIILQDRPWRKIINNLYHSSNKQIKPFMAIVNKPICLISYTREYFVSSCNKVRLTIDRDIKFFSQSNRIKPNISFTEPATDKIIIEWKAKISNSEILKTYIAEFPLRTTAFSKYISGTNYE